MKIKQTRVEAVGDDLQFHRGMNEIHSVVFIVVAINPSDTLASMVNGNLQQSLFNGFVLEFLISQIGDNLRYGISVKCDFMFISRCAQHDTESGSL